MLNSCFSIGQCIKFLKIALLAVSFRSFRTKCLPHTPPPLLTLRPCLASPFLVSCHVVSWCGFFWSFLSFPSSSFVFVLFLSWLSFVLLVCFTRSLYLIYPAFVLSCRVSSFFFASSCLILSLTLPLSRLVFVLPHLSVVEHDSAYHGLDFCCCASRRCGAGLCPAPPGNWRSRLLFRQLVFSCLFLSFLALSCLVLSDLVLWLSCLFLQWTCLVFS